MKPRLTRIILLPVLLAAGAAVAQEQSPPPGAMQARKACAADIQRLCPDAKPGQGGGLRMCLRDHQNDLSADCRAALAAMRAHRRQGQGGDQPPAPTPGPDRSPQH